MLGRLGRFLLELFVSLGLLPFLAVLGVALLTDANDPNGMRAALWAGITAALLLVYWGARLRGRRRRAGPATAPPAQRPPGLPERAEPANPAGQAEQPTRPDAECRPAPSAADSPPQPEAGPAHAPDLHGIPKDKSGFGNWCGERIARLGWRVQPVRGGDATTPDIVVQGPVGRQSHALPLWIRAEHAAVEMPEIRHWSAMAGQIGVPLALVATIDPVSEAITQEARRQGVLILWPEEIAEIDRLVADALGTALAG